MRMSALNYALIGVCLFALAFIVQMLMISRYAPTPALDDFNHSFEVTGAYKYYRASRSAGATWVNDTPLFCAAGAMGVHSCLVHLRGLPKSTKITVRIVNVKTLSGVKALAMNIKSDDRELFSQTPDECMRAWQNIDLYWFSGYSLMFSSFFSLLTYIFLKRDKLT